MTEPFYKFYLRKDAANYFRIINGAIVTDALKQPIPDPVNWRELELAYTRHERYHGIFRTNAAKIQFPLAGAEILRYLFLTQGRVMARCELYVEYRDHTDGQYYPLFTSSVDFATFKSFRDYVEVSLMDSNLSALINAYEDVTYEIPIDNSDAVNIKMDGINLKTQYNYLVGDGNTGNFTGQVTQGQQQDIIPFIFVRQIGDFSAGTGLTVVSAGPPIPYFFIANYTTEATIRYDFNLFYSNINGGPGAGDGFLRMRLEVWDTFPGTTGSTRIQNFNLWQDPNILNPGFSRYLNISGSHTEMLAPGWTMVLWLEVEKTSGSVIQIDYAIENNRRFYIDAKTATGEATIKGYRWGQVFSKLFAKLTENKFSLQSSYINNPQLLELQNYDATPYHTVVTSEQALKRLVPTPVIKTSLEEMYQDAIAGMGAGIGIKNEVLYIEKLAYFYNKDKLIWNLGDINNFQYTVMENYIVNKLTVGYDGYDAIDDINRINEFNTKQTYTFPITRVLNKNNQELNLVRPYYASMYYIELVRVQNFEDEIAVNNTKRDDANRNFLVYISNENAAGVYELDRSGVISGIEYPEVAYNGRISPKRTLLRNTPLIKSIGYGLPNQQVKFQTTDETKEMYSNFGSGNVLEKGDVNFAVQGGLPLFQPVCFTFDAPAPFNIFSMLEADPYGVIRFRYEGVEYDGFVLNVKLNPGVTNALSYELLSSPVNDLSRLVAPH